MYKGKIYFSCPDLDEAGTKYDNKIVAEIPENLADAVKLFGDAGAYDILLKQYKVQKQNEGRRTARGGKGEGKVRGKAIERA